jgi:hypothetical protein
MRRGLALATMVMTMIALPFAAAVPNPLLCGPVGSSTTGWAHTYDGDSAQHTVRPFVYDQCARHYDPDPFVPDSFLFDEYAAGIGGAVFMSTDDVVGFNSPANDLFWGTNTDPYTSVDPANVGGVNNCYGWPFTPHHGQDRYINTEDAVWGGDVLVYVAADNHDDPGEQEYDLILNANGGVWPAGVADPRDPCGDNTIDATDDLWLSWPCEIKVVVVPPTITGPCWVNTFDTWWTLAGISGLDGTVWTFVDHGFVFASPDNGNVGAYADNPALTGVTWTS